MIYITKFEAIGINKLMINKFGGIIGIRDNNLLESSLSLPQTTVFKKEMFPTVFEKASCYLFSITRNHPFLDGNKRTATACCIRFLDINKIKIEYETLELIEFVVEIAQGKKEKEEISKYLRSLCLDLEKSTL